MWAYLSVPVAAQVAVCAVAGMVGGQLLGRALVAATASVVRVLRGRRAARRLAALGELVPEWAPRTPLERFMASAGGAR